MIKFMQIENFKSLRRIKIGLGKLNLFFGCNGMGKTSLIQALLLLRQSYCRNSRSNRLYINDRLVELGTFKDVFCSTTVEDYLRFYLTSYEGWRCDCKYMYGSGSIDSIKATEDSIRDKDFEIFSNDFCYLGAEHLGPKSQYSSKNWDSEGINPLGNEGQYVVPFLAKEGYSYKVPNVLCMPGTDSNLLLDQVAAWMSIVSPGIRMNAIMNAMQQYAELKISYSNERLQSEEYSPINTGFGISYVLPVVVALLTSNSNSLILLENPESHLHPKGQYAMGKLMALASSNGAQILCESHSDHVINGVRVAIKKRVIDKDDVMVAYFTKNEDQETKVEVINVDQNGNLECYPQGLLDEWGNAMLELLV